jgi:hypothetical protein
MYKYLFISIIFIHGIIHSIGFLQGFGYTDFAQMSNEITKSTGVLWLMTGVLFVLCGIYFLFKNNVWVYFALIAIGFSQILIVYNWQDAIFGTIPNIIILLVTIISLFQIKFKKEYKKEVKISLNQIQTTPSNLLTIEDIKDLPEPVQKYIQYVGCVGKPIVSNFRVDFEGKIRSHDKPIWMELVSEQYNFVQISTRLFYLDAIMNYMPVAGFHCFKNGKAYMDIRLLSIFKVEYQSGPVMDVSETVTFFNDMCVMAPATLIDKRIQWLQVEGNTVKASFTNNALTISAWLYFNEIGELVNFVSDDRSVLLKDGKTTKLQWSTPMRGYKIIDGFRLASYAEAIYKYPDGEFVYATFSLRYVKYNSKTI